ncbi:lysine-specific histone demethylase 1 homolog 2 isoform X2 [Cynara cardunculus var. scolymus]|uniref:lysine-specific histone demethylase 1 homolog 2 isoform X2 n=1 Tax=Cynara cardunculus var. scolymus TaxID=59895 RepID=UPI000D629159|nr:lysine-specific histone demethylase 1 homolog 2 isoform X2 [Cynara cardunculus var. scolymus]
METPVSDGRVSKRLLRKKSLSRNYDENLMDDYLEKQLGGSVRKRFRTKKELEKETEKEAMIALSLGFPIDALLEEEIEANVVSELDGKEQNDYIVVRNHILSRWRANVQAWLSKGQIKETVSNEYDHLLHSAYDFLLFNGYINFGVSPPFKAQMPEEATEGSVIIVGAGLAGLAAARQLLAFGFKVIVLEGRNRPGGRVYTQKMGQKGNYAAVDLGGSVITGIHANPLGVLARQLSIPLHKVRDKCPLYNPEGQPVAREIDSKVEFIFNRLLDKVTEFRQIMGECATDDISLGSVLERLRQLYAVATTTEEKQLLDWHFANLEYANAGCLSHLSAAYWDQDDPYEMGGDHCFLAGGNWRLIEALCEGVPIFYEKTVQTVRYSNEGVEVTAGDQTYQADMVLCTVPLGVLKKKTIKFIPELPERKLEAIGKLGFGLLNKVAMVFPYVFWGEDLDTFGCLSKNSSTRGEFFLFYSYHTVSGGSVLVALVAGEAARSFEYTHPSTLLHRVLSILRENVENRLFFAGEATNRQHPATMHGAYLSGLREASCIYRVAKGKQTQTHPKKSIRKIGGVSDILVNLFKKPDLASGNFLFVFDPSTDDPKSMGLMMVAIDSSGSELCNDNGKVNISQHSDKQPMKLYTIVSRVQAQELQSVVGRGECGLTYLSKNLGLKLMGSDCFTLLANSLISYIATRRGRLRNRVVYGNHVSYT